MNRAPPWFSSAFLSTVTSGVLFGWAGLDQAHWAGFVVGAWCGLLEGEALS